MLLSYKLELKLKYEVKFHNSKSQPHARKCMTQEIFVKLLLFHR